MPGEERGGREVLQGSEGNKQPTKDEHLSMGSVEGKEEEEKSWKMEKPEQLKAFLSLRWSIRGQDTQRGQCGGDNGRR